MGLTWGPARPAGALESTPEPAGSGARGPARRAVLRVHVDRLVVEGMPGADPARIQAAMAARLRTLVDRTPDFDWGAVPRALRVDGGTLPPGAAPAEAGRHLVSRLFAALRAARAAGEDTGA